MGGGGNLRLMISVEVQFPRAAHRNFEIFFETGDF